MRSWSTGTVLALILSVMLVLTLTAYAYSAWSQSLRLNVYVKTGEFNVEIGSCKAVSCFKHVEFECDDCNDGFIIVENAFPGWEGWIGLVIANEGTLPAELYDVIIEASGDIADHIRVRDIYFYGPFKTSFKEVWGHVTCDDLPFDGYVLPPIEMFPGEKVVVWIDIYLDEETPYDSLGTLDITLEFTL